jgi:hypothetical protein
MDDDEDYVATENVSDEEIEDIDEAIKDEYTPQEVEAEDDVLSDYADEDEPVSEDDGDMDVDEPDGKKKTNRRKKNRVDDGWKAMTEEERNIKPYKMADKYTKARATIDQLCARFFGPESRFYGPNFSYLHANISILFE